jgi:hypothetical protein
MRLGRRSLFTALAAAPVVAQAQERHSMLQDLARRAAIYLFPVYEMYRVRWNATVNDQNPLRQKLNRFFHVPVLATPKSRAVTTPNNDTLYSSAWLELSGEPLFLTVPPMGERYYSFALMDLFTDNFAYVCHRLDGGQPRPRMIVGPAWQGDVQSEVRLVRAPTNSVWLLGRILVDGPSDLANVRALQARTLLETPDMRNERRIIETEELMRQRTIAPVEPVADWPAPSPNQPFDLFEVGMRALGESPLGQRDRGFIEELAPLKLRPGRKFDARAFSAAEQQAIRQGIADARSEIREAGKRYGTTIDGWNYSAPNIGNFGNDYLYRALIALSGLAALEQAEACYMSCTVDEGGRPLDGAAHGYSLTFPANGPPPVKAFWSLTMYEVTPEGRAFLVDNELGRYAIGDRTHGLAYGSDGSLTLYLQHERPAAADKLANWLPAPKGPMRLSLRAYEPAPAILEGRYRVPPVRRLS